MGIARSVFSILLLGLEFLLRRAKPQSKNEQLHRKVLAAGTASASGDADAVNSAVESMTAAEAVLVAKKKRSSLWRG